MASIRILPDILSNKIAAGEVVERPGSVVKELVENALDAQSTQVLVEIEKGGKSLIRVSDNGLGMNHDDALLAIERFATSKIHKDSDLFNISTLGFRGEAIPSIASVSRFTLVTRDKLSESGISIKIDGGKLIKAMETGAPEGTMVSVQQLFFNTPARRKFLKTVNTEMAHIADTLSSLAMAHPLVQFRLVHNGKEIKRYFPVSDPLERIVQVLGETFKNELYPIYFANDYFIVTGAIASPRISRSTSRAIYIYVNGRFVKDRMIQHAIFKGYHQRLMKGQFPVAVLFLKVPSETVDVNVHPTKHEVRFSHHKMIHDGIHLAIGDTLKNWENTPRFPTDENKKDPMPASHLFESVDTYIENQDPNLPPAPILESPGEKISTTNSLDIDLVKTHPETSQPLKPKTKPFYSEPQQQSIWKTQPFSDLKIIGQYHHTYILLEHKQGLILLDQHAAHERILYEELRNRSAKNKMGSQQLLVPETFDLGFSEAQILEKMIPSLEEFGLYIEPFGGQTFIVRAVPVIFNNGPVQPMIREIIEKILEDGISRDLTAAIDTSLKLMACHGAIRAGQKLSDIEIKELLSQMDQCENPSNCPHGRPTWIRWELKSLEKSFHRIA